MVPTSGDCNLPCFRIDRSLITILYVVHPDRTFPLLFLPLPDALASPTMEHRLRPLSAFGPLPTSFLQPRILCCNSLWPLSPSPPVRQSQGRSPWNTAWMHRYRATCRGAPPCSSS